MELVADRTQTAGDHAHRLVHVIAAGLQFVF